MTRKFFPKVVVLLLISLGFSIWLNRPVYRATNFPMHGLAFKSVYQPSSNYDLTDICSLSQEPNGYLLVSGSVKIRSIIGERQAFFETNTTSNRLFLEYDPGQNSVLQFGITDETGVPQFIRLGRIKKSGLLHFAFLMRQDGAIQVLGNGIVELPEQLTVGNSHSHQTNSAVIDCSNFRLNIGSGLVGTDGDVRVQISSGTSYENGLKLFNEYKLDYQKNLPVTNYKWPLYMGILLGVIDSHSVFLRIMKRLRPKVE